jgi:hypothetical protein
MSAPVTIGLAVVVMVLLPIWKYDKQTPLTNIFAWKIGLHEMFWDAIEEPGTIVHPSLGAAKSTEKETRQIPGPATSRNWFTWLSRRGKHVFHSRIKHEVKVCESLT